MIFYISDLVFRQIFNDDRLELPIFRGEIDFSVYLQNLFSYYITKIERISFENVSSCDSIHEIKSICNLLKRTVDHYLSGFPSKAYSTFCKVMKLLMKRPLRIYQKSVWETPVCYVHDPLRLFRIVGISDHEPQDRARVFHTPYNLRSKVSTNRYSIAGYPCLYLGTSLKLCCEEANVATHSLLLIYTDS